MEIEQSLVTDRLNSINTNQRALTRHINSDPTVRSALKFVTTDHVDKILDVAFGRRFAAAVKAAHKDAHGDAANVNLRQ